MKKLNLVTIVFIGLTLFSCQNEALEYTESHEKIPHNILIQLEKLGFDTNSIPVQKLKNGYRVEGDISISNKFLNNTTQYQSKQKYRVGALVSCKNARSIKIFNALPKKTAAAKSVKTAIKRWNNVKGSNLKFELVAKGVKYDIIIRDDTKDDALSDDGQLGTTGDFPQNGKPTQFVAINRNVKLQINGGKSPNLSQWINLMTHELGHGIGLYHNEETRFGVRTVPTTPKDDAKSIMTTSGRDFLILKGLSTNDRKALKRMYSTDTSKRLCK